MPSFGLYVVALVCSPLYFAMRRRWGGFVFNSILYAAAILLIFVFFIGVIPWMIGFAHAAWHIHGEVMERQAMMIAQRMKSVT